MLRLQVDGSPSIGEIHALLPEPPPPRFRRVDSDADGKLDISDAVATLGALFLGQGKIGCQDAADSNDDGTVDISDAINSLGVLFLGQGSIPLPGMLVCGVDPSDDEKGCDAYESCQ